MAKPGLGERAACCSGKVGEKEVEQEKTVWVEWITYVQ